jgi:hypothetical protein
VRILELEIKNWKKHNPRSDAKTCTWFKMSNDFFDDPDFFPVSGDGQRLWFYLLGRASKSMSGTVKINTQIVANKLRIATDAVDFALLELVKTGSLLQKPVTLISDELPAERKENVTFEVRALEKRREEERTEDKKREENVARDSEKNLPEKNPEDFRNSKDPINTGLKNPDELIVLWDATLVPKGFPQAPLQLSSSGADKFFRMNKLLHENGKTWPEYIARVCASDFLTKRKRGGPPPITWLFIEDNFDDVMAGKYDNHENDNAGDEDIYAKIREQA